MVVIVLTDCPPKLRGDLSKWLFEINTGVYVGRVSTRVRELLWERICENLNKGQATMVYPAAVEQRMEFRVHNTSWTIADYDGLKLMRRPLPMSEGERDNGILEAGFSKAAAYRKINRMQRSGQKQNEPDDYVVVDIETTGLSHLSNEIMEIAALKVVCGQISEKFNTLVRCEKEIPESVVKLTGISRELLEEQGTELETAMKDFLVFVADNVLVCHNAAFDYRFIQAACRKCALQLPQNKCIDTLAMARKKLRDIPDYKLQTLAAFFSLEIKAVHRALDDCYLGYGIYEKLKEI